MEHGWTWGNCFQGEFFTIIIQEAFVGTRPWASAATRGFGRADQDRRHTRPKIDDGLMRDWAENTVMSNNMEPVKFVARAGARKTLKPRLKGLGACILPSTRG